MAQWLQARPRLTVLLWGVAGGAASAGTAVLASTMGIWPAIVLAAAVLGMVLGVLAQLAVDSNRRLRRLAYRRGGLPEIISAVSDLPTRNQTTTLVQRAVSEARDQLRRDISRVETAARDDARQLEALLNLHAMIPVRQALPRSRGWAASPDLLLTYIDGIMQRRPSLVVECGSGLSTLWAALALDIVGGPGKVVALEHDPEFLADTMEALQAHGVAHRAEVRLAPIGMATVEGRQWPWYDVQALAGLSEIGVLFVDGPIGSLAPESRYPAVPLLRDKLVPGAMILLDDTDRPGEREVVDHWRADWPELVCEMLSFEKGAARITVPGAPDGPGWDSERDMASALDSVIVPEDHETVVSG